MRVPSGSTAGSAATMPGRASIPDAVVPVTEYAVATNSAAPGAR